ncbi:MAG: transposase, partial [Planctomycetaceae bacterium]|nr:transposase [Planctomycetaceae bacterium]
LVEPFRTTVQLLTTIPGVDELSACVILAEIGRDMSRFPSAGHPGFRRGRLVWGLCCQGPWFAQSRP